MITREADGTIYTHAGPEIGVASTKAFTAAAHRALHPRAAPRSGARNHLEGKALASSSTNSLELPGKLEHLLAQRRSARRLWPRFSTRSDFLFLGRGIHYPIALEGALKLKEISYIHAEGYPAGEMKHGPNALIDETLPVVIHRHPRPERPELRCCATKKPSPIIQEVNARYGQVIAIATEGDEDIKEAADHVLYIPAAPEVSHQFSKSSRYNCSPITLPCAEAAT